MTTRRALVLLAADDPPAIVNAIYARAAKGKAAIHGRSAACWRFH